MENNKNKFLGLLFIILFVGSLLRLGLAANFYGTSDVGAWEQASAYSKVGKSPYDETYRYNYSPVWFWIISGVTWLADKTGATVPFAVKWPLWLADLAITAVLLKILSVCGQSAKTKLIVVAGFFLNPVSILISGYHGQFDNISLFFVLLACYFHEIRKERGFLGILLAFSMGVAVKHFNALLTPLFVFAQKPSYKKLIMFLGPPILFALFLWPYFLSSREHVIRNIFHHELGSGYWGWCGVICRSALFFTGMDLTQAHWFGLIKYFNTSLYLVMAVLSYFLVKKRDLFECVTIQFLIFYVFTTQMGPQYSAWILPFAALRPKKEFYVYSFMLTLQLLLFFYCHTHWFHEIPFVGFWPSLASKGFVITRYATWAICVWWLWRKIKKGNWDEKRTYSDFKL